MTKEQKSAIWNSLFEGGQSLEQNIADFDTAIENLSIIRNAIDEKAIELEPLVGTFDNDLGVIIKICIYWRGVAQANLANQPTEPTGETLIQ